jgi:hypothetical protein
MSIDQAELTVARHELRRLLNADLPYGDTPTGIGEADEAWWVEQHGGIVLAALEENERLRAVAYTAHHVVERGLIRMSDDSFVCSLIRLLDTLADPKENCANISRTTREH